MWLDAIQHISVFPFDISNINFRVLLYTLGWAEMVDSINCHYIIHFSVLWSVFEVQMLLFYFIN